MCLNPGCWKRSSCEWVSCWVTTSILSVYAASFCCISVYTPYPGRQAGCSDSGSYSTLWDFLGGATGPSVFWGPGEFLLGIHIFFSPFKFFTLLELLMYFFSSAWWHFPSKQSSQLEAAKAQKSALAANFWGGGSTPYGFFLLIGMAPICSYIQVSRKHSFVCFFFLLPFLWIKPGRDLHTVLTARLVTCGWTGEKLPLCLKGQRDVQQVAIYLSHPSEITIRRRAAQCLSWWQKQWEQVPLGPNLGGQAAVSWGKCHILPLGRNRPNRWVPWAQLGRKQLCRKRAGSLASKLNTSQQWALPKRSTAGWAVSQAHSQQARNGICSFCSALPRLRLDCLVHSMAP